jgi:tripeptide aminopeptidase
MARTSKPRPIADTINPREAVALVTEMMAIPGKSCEEARVVEYLRRRLKAAGVPASAVTVDACQKQSPFGGEVGNLILKLPGTVRGPRRLLMSHMDTVPLCVGARPVRRGDLIVARDPHTALGADNRAGCSVLLNTVLEIFKRKLPHPPLTIFWAIQEEIGLVGARYVSIAKLGTPKLCFNWDGGEPHQATIGATGGYDIDILIEGIASHAGGRPEQGVSAAAIASVAIADLVRNGWHGLVIKGQNAGTSNVGVVQGGDATNVVMPHLELRAEARSHDPKFRSAIVDEFRKAFDRAAAEVRNDTGQTGRVRFEADLKYESFRLREDEPAVTTAKAAIASVGLTPQIRITNGGLDANWLSARGLPTVTFGCGQQDVHTVKESLVIRHFLDACRIGLALATGAA